MLLIALHSEADDRILKFEPMSIFLNLYSEFMLKSANDFLIMNV